jgi:hypothetical protein
LTDEEILAPGVITFPNGGAVNVHSVGFRQVYFARRMPGSNEWELLRKAIPLFLTGVRDAKGERP